MTTLSLLLPDVVSEALRELGLECLQEHSRPRPVRYLQPEAIRVPGVLRPVEVKVASEPEEWDQAFQLVACSYRECGYEALGGKPYRFTPYHALPDTTVFVAKIGPRVVATFSLVADNELLGLPLEALFAAEVAMLRDQGRRLAEVTSLAVTDLSQREFLQVFTTMIRVMKQYHVAQGGDTWVITVNPRHRNFYSKVLGYAPLGECKPYAAVGHAPAEAFVLDQELMRRNAPKGYLQIFGEPVPPEVLRAPALPRPFIRYFGSESTQTDEIKLGAILRAVADGRSYRRW